MYVAFSHNSMHIQYLKSNRYDKLCATDVRPYLLVSVGHTLRIVINHSNPFCTFSSFQSLNNRRFSYRPRFHWQGGTTSVRCRVVAQAQAKNASRLTTRTRKRPRSSPSEQPAAVPRDNAGGGQSGGLPGGDHSPVRESRQGACDANSRGLLGQLYAY